MSGQHETVAAPATPAAPAAPAAPPASWPPRADSRPHGLQEQDVHPLFARELKPIGGDDA